MVMTGNPDKSKMSVLRVSLHFSSQQLIILVEDGLNRLMVLKTIKSPSFKVEDLWNYRQIKLKLYSEKLDNNQSIMVLGDCPEFGVLKNPKQMDQIKNENIFKNSKEFYWKFNAKIPLKTKNIQYYYALYDSKQDKFTYERNIERIINFTQSEILTDNSHYLKGNIIMKNDHQFQDNFVYQQVSQNLIYGKLILFGILFTGTFPYTTEEVTNIHEKGVKAIMNINNFEEFQVNTTNFQIVAKEYPKQEIEWIDYQIRDDDEQYILNEDKVQHGAQLLNSLLQTYQTVYIHSTLGKTKTLKVVINYLCIFKHFSIDAAYKFLRTSQKQFPNNKSSWLTESLFMQRQIVYRSISAQRRSKSKNRIKNMKKPLFNFNRSSKLLNQLKKVEK